MKLFFNINFQTKLGEKLQLLILDHPTEPRYHGMRYLENGTWVAEVDHFSKSIVYKYQLVDLGGNVLDEEFPLHRLNFANSFDEFEIFDVWNLKNFPENYLNNKILDNTLKNFRAEKVPALRKHSHLFRIEAPLYNPNWKLVMTGNVDALGNWDRTKAIEMAETDYGIWEAAVEAKDRMMIQYKYGIKDKTTGEVFDVEYGENRWAFPNRDSNILYIKADHYFRYKDYEMYHAAGVAVPVFSLRSESGFGVGEFSDVKKLADWAHQSGLSIIQILPINDTTANYSWTDSYPYAAISVYALHPQYLNIEKLTHSLPKDLVEAFNEERSSLNALPLIDYEKMIRGKWKFAKAAFDAHKDLIYKDKDFKKFLKDNESWLLPYAAFCVQRDKYRTPNFNDWKTHKKYISGKVSVFFSAKSKDYDAAMLHGWVQYQLHLQLKDAVNYAHSLGISIKGDLPIGIYRYSVEAWAEPELFGMDFQAGAPPDDFTDLGQNWGFPTYNWDAMKADGYRWWKNRFKALEQYFDAMRIDHILGFFRIWRMPMSATQGILGYFYPAIPVRLEEFQARNIPFNYDRYCMPFVNDQILWDLFGQEKENIALEFFENHFNGLYSFKNQYNTQRKLTEHFEKNPHPWAEDKLISLCANVLFLQEHKGGDDYVYHPRFNLHKTDSYKYLSDWEKQSLNALYHDYFFKRQDALWYQSAMEKLPVILNSTKMLICGEDLGLVPDCVPEVMDRLAITALKVQRMPKEDLLWYDPRQAGYMNVVTASSHDSSTLRQWWHENRELTQKYFNAQLNQWGTAPADLHPELSEIIMKQHLYTAAMLAIFPIQEFFATDAALMSPNMDDERINNPAVFPHYWRYRMHIDLENLVNQKDFSAKISSWIRDCGRV